ncbi:zinc-binding dehydrogenase [Nocardia asteroides]
MDRAVDSSAAEQRGVRRVHDGVDLLFGDVTAHQHQFDHASHSARTLWSALGADRSPHRSRVITPRSSGSPLSAVRMLVEHDHAGMLALAGPVESGDLRPALAGSFPLSEAAKAHALGDTGRTVGKLVLTVL